MTSTRDLSGSQSRISTLAYTSIGHFINDGTTYLVPVIADFLSVSQHASVAWITAMLTLYYLASTLASTLVGRLADRSGRHGALMAQGMMLMSVGLIGYYVGVRLNGPYVLPITLASSVLVGLGSSYYHPIGAAMLSSSFGEKSKGRALGLNGAMGSLGRALYPSIYFAVAALLTKPGGIAFFGFLGLAASLLVYQSFRSVRIQLGNKAAEAAGFKRALTRGIIVLTVVGFVRSAAIQAITSWMPTYFTYAESLGFTASVGLLVTLMYTAGIFGQPAFGFLVERFDKRYVIAASFLGTSLSLLGYLYTRGLASYTLLFCFGFATFSGFPLFLSLATDYAPPEAAAFGNSLVWGIGMTGGGTVGPILAALLTGGDYLRLPHAFIILAYLNLAVTVGLLLLPKPAKKGAS